MPSPIIALDHLRISVAELAAAEADYRLLLGMEARQPATSDTPGSLLFAAGNISLSLVASEQPRGLEAVCFRVDNLARMRRRLQRVGLDPQPASDPATIIDTAPDADEMLTIQVRGLELLFVSATRERPDLAAAPSLVSGLDHVVISSGDAQATAFLLAAQLGLDLRMDMSRPEWGARLLFFRCGDSIVEVVQQLDSDASPDTDQWFGISWRVHNADAAQASLAASGFDVSKVRSGRKPGSRVLTVRDRTAGVATLLLEPPRS